MRQDDNIRIALALPLEWEYAHRLTDGVLSYQDERGGFSIRDFRFSDPNFKRPEGPPTWSDWRPHGVVCAVGTEPGLAQWLISSGLPLVNTTADVPQEVIPSVHCSDAGKVAVEHFVSLGYRRIAHVGLKGMRGSQLRRKNITKDILDAGCEPLCYELAQDPIGGTDERFEEVASEPGLLDFLRDTPKPLAVSAMNDDFARCVCMACHSLGLSIPSEVAVLGVDDTSVAKLNHPPLSSIRTPGEHVGYTAMKLLDQLIAGSSRPEEPILIPCEAVAVRQSTQQSEDTSIDRALRIITSEACQGLSVSDLVRMLGVGRSSLNAGLLSRSATRPAWRFNWSS